MVVSATDAGSEKGVDREAGVVVPAVATRVAESVREPQLAFPATDEPSEDGWELAIRPPVDPSVPSASDQKESESDRGASDAERKEADEERTAGADVSGDETMPLNLPTALAIIGGEHPVVGVARWRVQEAYARWEQARVLWLPSLQSGFHIHRHDGNIQASNGAIIDLDRSSVQYGLGVGAVGASQIFRPGVVAEFHLADAIFQPQIARNRAGAAEQGASAVLNRQLLDVAIAYFEWLESHQDLRILEVTQERMAELVKLTEDFAATGQGLRADADRLRTELILLEGRLQEGRERMEVAEARMVQTLSLPPGTSIEPGDRTLLPLEWIDRTSGDGQLISMALAGRPELRESQALVAAACEEYRRQKFAPMVPSVMLGFSTGRFGGGMGGRLADVEGRYDLDALMAWEVRQLGFGERAARRESSARVQQARFEKLRVLDQVAREVMESHARVRHRVERVAITQRAIEFAESSHQLNVARIRDGEGLPLEVLQSVQALEQSQRAYLRAVVDHNQSQLEMQWALGWPLTVEPAG
ncbi:MAG: TolC family protein [Planctomycetaceae bacterium]|nr:MAG: TolC family protein [Planctomycetaceae bacterium]